MKKISKLLMLSGAIVPTIGIVSTMTSCGGKAVDPSGEIGNAQGTDWKGWESGELKVAFKNDGDGQVAYIDARLGADRKWDYKANNLVIPNFILKDGKRYPLTEIYPSAFTFEDPTGSFISSPISGEITIPDNVKLIKQHAFANCAGLTGVTIGNGVTEIGEVCFVFCSSLVHLNLSNATKLELIGGSAFAGCKISNIELNTHFVRAENVGGATVIIPVADKGTGLNSGCYNVVGSLAYGELTIPNTVINIGDQAFAGCGGLTGVTIGDNVQTIGVGAFYLCTGLNKVTFGEKVTSISEVAFSECISLTGELTIPDSVTSIGSRAFEGCSGFTGDLTIPNTVISIGSRAFAGCSESMFDKENVGDGVVYYSNKTEGHDPVCLGAYEHDNKPTGPLTFKDNTRLIEMAAFQVCDGLTGGLAIPDSVKIIGDSAFYECTGLSGQLTIGNTVQTIGYQAFFDCQGFTEKLTIPNSVLSIGNEAFNGCNDDMFVEAIVGSGPVYYSKQAEGHDPVCFGARNVSKPTGQLRFEANTRLIVGGAFENCSSLGAELTIPDSVLSIGNEAFSGCSGFTGELTIGQKVTSIGVLAFNSCSGLTGVTFKNMVQTIGKDAFYYCSALASIVGNYTAEPSNINNAAFIGLPTTGMVQNNNSTYSSEALLTFLKTKGLPSGWSIE